MAQGDGVVVNNFKEQLLKGVVDLSSGAVTVRVGMLTGFTVAIDTNAVYADISASEVSGTGYTAGGEAVGSKTVTQDDTNDRGVFDGADVPWTSLLLGQTPSHIFIRVVSPDLVIGFWENTVLTNGGNYTVEFAAAGILLLT